MRSLASYFRRREMQANSVPGGGSVLISSVPLIVRQTKDLLAPTRDEHQPAEQRLITLTKLRERVGGEETSRYCRVA